MYIEWLKKWQDKLELNHWTIVIKSIESKQVVFPKDLEFKEFIGIYQDKFNHTGTIYHNIPLYEDAIIHELLHVKYPEASEEWINEKTIVTKNA